MITQDRFVLEAIQGYKIRFAQKPHQAHPPNVTFNSKKQFLRTAKAIETLVEKGVIRPCQAHPDQFLSPYFLTPKPDGTDRFILNLQKLNKFLVKEHFKLEDFRSVMQLVFPGHFMATIDLQDAFHLIPIAPEHRIFLRFYFDGVIYEFEALPFGLSQCPLVFTKVMKPVVRHLRSMDLTSVVYLDDFLFIEKTEQECKRNVQLSIQVLEFLGFIVKYGKSNLDPNTYCRYLGFFIDSKNFRIELPLEKRTSILSLVSKLISLKRCKISFLAKIIGKLIAAAPAVEYGWLYTKLLERAKTLGLIHNNYNYNNVIDLPEYALHDLRWWQKNVKTAVNPIKTLIFQATICTDASKSGWGATDGTYEVSGFWTPEQEELPINYLELLAIKYGLEKLASDVKNSQILIRSDNTTAISYINKMGGSRFLQYYYLAHEIWTWAQERHNFIIASYIPSKENKVADYLSRLPNPDTEWSLSESAFRKIVECFGMPDIDLFASIWNAKCNLYVTRYPVKQAPLVDALTLNWSHWFFYAFPPFSLILKTLVKIKQDNAEGIVVVPNWPNQTWFPLFKKLAYPGYIIFEPDTYLLSSIDRTSHPQNQHLSLIAARVSGSR